MKKVVVTVTVMAMTQGQEESRVGALPADHIRLGHHQRALNYCRY